MVLEDLVRADAARHSACSRAESLVRQCVQLLENIVNSVPSDPELWLVYSTFTHSLFLRERTRELVLKEMRARLAVTNADRDIRSSDYAKELIDNAERLVSIQREIQVPYHDCSLGSRTHAPCVGAARSRDDFACVERRSTVCIEIDCHQVQVRRFHRQDPTSAWRRFWIVCRKHRVASSTSAIETSPVNIRIR